MRTIAFALILLLIVQLLILQRRVARNGEWHIASGYRMRAWRGGRWHYRQMTDAELADYSDAKVW